MRRTYFSLAAIAFWAALLCGCSAAGSLFTPGEESATQPDAPIQTIIRDAADATGNPWIQAAGSVLAAGIGYFLARKGARKDAASAIKRFDALPESASADEVDTAVK